MKCDPFKAKRRKNERTNLLHLVGRQLAPDAAVVGGVAPHQVVPSLGREKNQVKSARNSEEGKEAA